MVGTDLHPVTQVNNLYLFPGLGRGVVAVGATRVSDSMLSAAATAIGSVAPRDPAAPSTLLPPLAQVGEVADAVALAVARQAVAEGLAEPLDDDHIVEGSRSAQVAPAVPRVRRIRQDWVNERRPGAARARGYLPASRPASATRRVSSRSSTVRRSASAVARATSARNPTHGVFFADMRVLSPGTGCSSAA